ncbi:MAG: DUF2812 domain-containing protein [Clostridiales bacterium]|nr:DUF2812 domain-containing protein [Clostridiales bacterium]
MNDKYKYQLYMGSIGDIKNLEKHFSFMAEKGWMIDKFGITQRYHSIEPSKKRFYVDILPQITAFDYPDNDEALAFRSMCQGSGWEFVTANKQIQVFCAESNAVPIHTDNKIQAQIYLKTCRKYELPLFIYGLLIFFFFCLVMGWPELLLSNLNIFLLIGSAFFTIGYLWTFFFVLSWYWKTSRSVKNNLPMPEVNYSLYRIRSMVYIISFLLFVLCIAIGAITSIVGGMPPGLMLPVFMPFLSITLGLWVRHEINTTRRGRKENIRLMIAVCAFIVAISFLVINFVTAQSLNIYPGQALADGQKTLTLKNIGIETPPEHSSARVNSSVAVPVNYEYFEVNHEGSVSTEVYRSVAKPIAETLYGHFVLEFEESSVMVGGGGVTQLSSDEASFWGAVYGVSVVSPDNIDLILLNGRDIIIASIRQDNFDMDILGEEIKKLWANE